MPGWVKDVIAFSVVFIGIPAVFIFSVLAPFLFVHKILKRRLTLASGIIATLIAIVLIALDLYGLYWFTTWISGVAFCDIYGC